MREQDAAAAERLNPASVAGPRSGPPADAGAGDWDRRVRAARSRLETAERRLATLRACLEGVARLDPRYFRLLPHCQSLERSLFSRRLELDEVLREGRRVRVRGK